MGKKGKKTEMWFGCKGCQYIPEKNKTDSNENWNVFDNRPCPQCGKEMGLNIKPSSNQKIIKKYYHKLTNMEIDAIPPEMKCSELRELYSQPDWCSYPDAIDALGCWSLIGICRTKISKKFCKNCDCFVMALKEK
jgi:hypothetical protein